MADYLSYWKPSTVRDALERSASLLSHAASGQYNRVEEGDTVWIVTTWSGGFLVLLGPIAVWKRTDHVTAASLLGTDDLWDAPFHIIAPPGREAVLREVDIGDLAPRLRFESDRDRLNVQDPVRIGSQLQAMRRLNPASAVLLRERWSEEDQYVETLGSIRRDLDAGGGFGSPESNRELERAAITLATKTLENDGWIVESVERDRIGFDLHCTRAEGEQRHVEVKGTRGSDRNFIITQGEYLRSGDDPAFWLYLVTNALTANPTVHRFSREELERLFTFVPLAYRAVPARP
jgi:hypothetical protein